MSLKTHLKKRGLTLDDVLGTDDGEPIPTNSHRVNSLTLSKVYDKWLAEQPAIVQVKLPKQIRK